MSDENSDTNDLLIMIAGESASGKSAALQKIRNQGRWLYLNCESGKKLPFKNDFWELKITDPYQVFEAFEAASEGGELYGQVDGIIIDSVTFLMDMFESNEVLNSGDTQKAWGEYAQFFKRIMQKYVPEFHGGVIVTAHNKSEYDEKALQYRTRVAIKGAIGNGNGAESYFSTVVYTKKIELKHLEDQDRELLSITEDDEILGYKHVFQTRLTKDTIGERIRSPMGMFSKSQTYMDNDAQLLLDHLSDYYGLSDAA